MNAAGSASLLVSRRAMVACVLLGILASAAYPGGTALDRSALGYSVFRNFISDLGMTVAHDGHPNRLGAALFTASFAALVLSLAATVRGFLALHASAPRSVPFARSGAVGGVIAALCLLGTALAPANQAGHLHKWLAGMATISAVPTLVLLAIASARDQRLPARATLAWGILALAMSIWFAMRWAPAATTPTGLTIHATVQKLVAAVVVIVVTFQSYQGSAAARLDAAAR